MTKQATSNAGAKQPAPTTRKAKAQETKPANSEASTNSHPAPSKTAQVLSLLSRPEGATLQQMVEATGWLPHTTRAALTGLKKKGHEVTSVKADGVRTYRVAPVQSEGASAAPAIKASALS